MGGELWVDAGAERAERAAGCHQHRQNSEVKHTPPILIGNPSTGPKEVCAWCKTVLREGTEPVSHGICGPCEAKHFPKAPALTVNPATGQQVLVMPPRRATQVEKRLNYPVEGLKCFETSLSLKFVYTSLEPIDEADARNAQCRAGWSDYEHGHGFFSFETQQVAGVWRATWCCWKSTE